MNKKRELDFSEMVKFINKMTELASISKNLSSFDLEFIKSVVNQQIEDNINPAQKIKSKYTGENRSKTTLIGVLPKFLNDIQIFPKNEDLAKFAYEVLGITITRFEKRSRYELIGFITIEIIDLDDDSIDKVVEFIVGFIDSDLLKKDIIKRKSNENFTWFDYISENT